jgi:hypothetical protein
MFLFGLLLLNMGMMCFINQGYNFFADNATIYIIVFWILVCHYFKKILIKIVQKLNLWSASKNNKKKPKFKI